MEPTVSSIGGAKAGWINASWPLARLSSSASQLTLSISLMGSYSFTPAEVIALERRGSIPLFSSGIRIVHTNPNYPENLVFWCVTGRDRLIERIKRTGFRPLANPSQVPRRNGMPWRWPFLLAVIVVWNVLFLVDFADWGQGRQMGYGVLTAVGLLFATAVALGLSHRVRALALKQGRSFAEVQPLVRLVGLGSAMMLIIVTMHVAG